MTLRYRLLSILSTALLLAGCAQQPQAPQVQNELSQINQQLRDLTDRAAALEQQNTLNANSTTGVYLLPAAKNNVPVDSTIGRLSLMLSQVEPEANGTRALLRIRTMNTVSLPSSFQAQLDWGMLDPVSGKPLARDIQTQTLNVEQAQMPKSDITIEIRLSGITPEQLGFVRIYQITATTTGRLN
ncbi:SadB/YajI family lipoprotein [Musicola paradisiaca]|uniref:DUF3251 domain-containing protein n=1 Tax=Musicola paradisiaca (strain Ech703) TaxID=579405 RepID=C6CBE9_MUSP7|nr:DUF3251 domain-containing protein [Musicola paradisiaca]ACS86677.1 conserved hypothetical protein [Musicola paradisiaca Ech703]